MPDYNKTASETYNPGRIRCRVLAHSKINDNQKLYPGQLGFDFTTITPKNYDGTDGTPRSVVIPKVGKQLNDNNNPSKFTEGYDPVPGLDSIVEEMLTNYSVSLIKLRKEVFISDNAESVMSVSQTDNNNALFKFHNFSGQEGDVAPINLKVSRYFMVNSNYGQTIPAPTEVSVYGAKFILQANAGRVKDINNEVTARYATYLEEGEIKQYSGDDLKLDNLCAGLNSVIKITISGTASDDPSTTFQNAGDEKSIPIPKVLSNLTSVSATTFYGTLGSSSNKSTVNAASVTANNYDTWSDRRLKDNINDARFDALSVIENIELFTFNYKDDKDKIPHLGIIAQDIEHFKVNDVSLVNRDEKGFLSIKNNELMFVMWRAIQQLQNKIKEMESK